MKHINKNLKVVSVIMFCRKCHLKLYQNLDIDTYYYRICKEPIRFDAESNESYLRCPVMPGTEWYISGLFSILEFYDLQKEIDRYRKLQAFI